MSAPPASAYTVSAEGCRVGGKFPGNKVVVTEKAKCIELCRFFAVEWKSHSIWYSDQNNIYDELPTFYQHEILSQKSIDMMTQSHETMRY